MNESYHEIIDVKTGDKIHCPDALAAPPRMFYVKYPMSFPVENYYLFTNHDGKICLKADFSESWFLGVAINQILDLYKNDGTSCLYDDLFISECIKALCRDYRMSQLSESYFREGRYGISGAEHDDRSILLYDWLDIMEIRKEESEILVNNMITGREIGQNESLDYAGIYGYRDILVVSPCHTYLFIKCGSDVRLLPLYDFRSQICQIIDFFNRHSELDEYMMSTYIEIVCSVFIENMKYIE